VSNYGFLDGGGVDGPGEESEFNNLGAGGNRGRRAGLGRTDRRTDRRAAPAPRARRPERDCPCARNIRNAGLWRFDDCKPQQELYSVLPPEEQRLCMTMSPDLKRTAMSLSVASARCVAEGHVEVGAAQGVFSQDAITFLDNLQGNEPVSWH
jgi:hypothetical protein